MARTTVCTTVGLVQYQGESGPTSGWSATLPLSAVAHPHYAAAAELFAYFFYVRLFVDTGPTVWM